MSQTGAEVHADDGEQPNEIESKATESEPTASEEQITNLSLDIVFEILKNGRRRATLHYLSEHEGQTTLDELAESIAAEENDITTKEVNSSQRKRVYIALYQSHLPKMADAGIIEYNKPRGTIELNKCADHVYQYLHLEADEAAGDGSKSAITSVTSWITSRL